tara:strand:- start:39 stop:761 length:723 start_codon:yes stop_codon:yes gene_type:complete
MAGEKVDKSKALNQWNNLKDKIISLGAKVEQIDAVQGLPDMIFTANCGIVYGNQFVLSRMRHQERQPESQYFRKWFKRNGYSIVDLMPGVYFEGRGDVLVHKGHLIAGHGFRSTLSALQIVSNVFGLELIDLQLVDPRFYHLDTCFCMVSDTQAVYYPSAFQDGEIQKLSGVVDLIPVEESDARLFACNSMLVEGELLVPESSLEVNQILSKKYGVVCTQVTVREFLKSGGSIQCLCLRI